MPFSTVLSGVLVWLGESRPDVIGPFPSCSRLFLCGLESVDLTLSALSHRVVGCSSVAW